MLGLLVDLVLGMVRAQVALPAGLGLPGLSYAEQVSRVAGGTGPQAAVGIDTANAHIRPPLKLAALVGDNEASVTFDASQDHVIVVIGWFIKQAYLLEYAAVREQGGQGTLGHLFGIELPCRGLGQRVESLVGGLEPVRLQRADKGRPGVLGVRVLFHLLSVAALAVLGRRHGGYLIAVVVVARWVALLRLVAYITFCPDLAVLAVKVLLHNARCGRLVTSKARVLPGRGLGRGQSDAEDQHCGQTENTY